MKDNHKQKSAFKEMISGDNGFISSKRVVGIITLAVCLGCTIWLVISEGGTPVVENLLQTLMIMAAALLGISSITRIWKYGKHSETAKTIEDVNTIESNPCETCVHNKKQTL